MHPRKLLRLGLLVGLALVPVALGAGGAAGSGVEPATFSATVPVGGSVTITKTVHTPVIPPVPDVYFLSDTTGSMGRAIANVQENAGAIMDSVMATQPGARFGAGDYKDFPVIPPDFPYAFKNDASIGPTISAIGGIGSWAEGGGSDGPEAALYALHRIATDPSIGWRAGSTRVLVWFGDSPSHDPICSAFTGEGSNITTGSVAAELAAAHIRVIAISFDTGNFPAGLNDDSSQFEFDYDGVCGPAAPVSGEAATIAAATGGLNLFAASPEDISTSIISGLANLLVTVTPTPTCDPGLTASYDAASKTVTSGTDALFSETFDVAGNVAGGTTLHCSVDFLLNGIHQPDFQQTAAITVPAQTGTIVVRTQTFPGGGTTPFTFTGDAAGTAADGGAITVANLPAGTYTSTESALAGWDLTGLTCDDSDSTGDVASGTATFRLAAGETVTCTFANSRRAQLVVRETTNPSPDPTGTQFPFDGDAGGLIGNGGTFTQTVPVGVYSVHQHAPLGWDLTGLSCDDPAGTGSVATATATFRLNAGQKVTCTFTDTSRGTIVVRKRTLPSGDPTVFAFTGAAAGPLAGDGAITVGNLAPGTYTSTESALAGWDLTGLTCDDSDSTGSLATGTATFHVSAGETVTCTFTNTRRGSIVVRSRTLPAGDATAFAFTGDAAGPIASDGGTIAVDHLAPGTYTSTEAVPAGWDLSALTCDDSDSTGDLAAGSATFRLAAGETVTCTFTNTKRGKVVVKETTNPSPDATNTQFAFAGQPAGSIGNGGTASATVPPGTYTATQAVPAGWDLTAVTCDDSDSSGVLATGIATFRVAAGETVTCTFADTRRATLVVKKATVPSPDPGNTAFTFTGHPAATISTAATASETVAPGTYTSTEAVPAGWDLTGLTCDDSNSTGSVSARTATFVAAAGETVTCTFTNTKRATIVVKQTTNPSPDPSTTTFAFTGHPAGAIANGGMVTETVVPGTYTSTQTVPTGWDLTGLTCDDGDSTGSVSTRTATFKVAAGEVVTCTFTDTKRPQIIVKEATLPSPDPVNTAFTFTGHPAGTAVNGATIAETETAAGTYTAVQTVPGGWDLTAISCNDSNSTGSVSTKTATFVAAAGETVTCTFTDTKRGSLALKQVTNPSTDTQKFTYTGHPAGQIANGGTLTETNVVPGTYTSVQTVPSGFGLSSIVCSDTDSGGTAPSKTATFKLGPGETVTCTFTDTDLPSGCGCLLDYPTGRAPALSSVVFGDSGDLRTYEALPTSIALWYNDAHAMTLGVRQVVVKAKSGTTTTTNYPITALSADPGHAVNPLLGTTLAGSGTATENPLAGTDIATWTSSYGTIDKGRPIWPAVFVTDITTNPDSTAGDWQQGGTAVPPSDVFGTWKGMVKTVDQTRTPHTITLTPDADPAKNNWTLGTGSDTPTGGFSSFLNKGYGTELRWSISSLGLKPGHLYRLEFMVHDGDEDKGTGDAGEVCFDVFIPGV